MFSFTGCVNGGGQIRSETQDTAKDLLSAVEQLYLSVPCRTPNENQQIEQLYKEWLGGSETEKAKLMLHTQYHEVEKMTNALVMKW